MAFAVVPPGSEAELLDRAGGIAGRTLMALAAAQGHDVPADQRRAKGWVGQLLERALGATAANRPLPDFPELGVELKTLPVNRHGRPRETTFVCAARLPEIPTLEWADSDVKKKLARVLWIPVESEPSIPLAQRRVGNPALWSPDEAQERSLRADWEDLAGVIAAGYVESISASRGQVLQLRPKGANSAERRWGPDADGGLVRTPGRAFYLRTSFTAQIIERRYAVAAPSGSAG